MKPLREVVESKSDENGRNYGPRDFVSFAYFKIFCDAVPRFIGTLVYRLKCLAFGVGTGKKVRCFGAIHLLRAPGSQIVVGDNVTFISRSSRGTASAIYSPCKLRTHARTARIEIGDNVGLNGTSVTARSRTIKIGDGTMVGPNVTIVDSDFHQTWPPDGRLLNPAMENDRDVIIGENVWIGLGSIILKGVTIGDNSIIGAGSVVISDIPENSLAAGNPAVVKKSYVLERR